MKILYGIQTTGNGHISRSEQVVENFRQRGHKVDIVLSGPKSDISMTMPYLSDAKVFCGMSQVIVDNHLSILASIRKNNLFKFLKEIKSLSLEVGHYDLIISDFEPLTAWAGKLKKTFVMSLCNQNTIKLNKKIPIKGNYYFGHKQTHKYFAPGHLTISLGWEKYTPSTLPPIIKSNAQIEFHSGKYLVYLPCISLKRQLKIFSAIERNNFIIYHPDIDERDSHEHLTLNPLNPHKFQEDFSIAEGVISNAGFSLISEAIAVGKKLLVCPVKGLLEQELNAYLMEKIGYGERIEELTVSAVDKYLMKKNLNIPMVYPKVAAEFVKWVEMKNWTQESLQALVKKLWLEVKEGKIKS